MDSEGFVWIASVDGLGRFDGHSVKKYFANTEKASSVADNYITGKFLEDGNKNIWFCTNTSIQRYNRLSDNFSTYFLTDPGGKPVKSGYKALFLERDSFLWISAGEKEFFRFNIRSFTQSDVLGAMELDIDVFPGALKNGALARFFVVDGSKSPGIEVFAREKDDCLFRVSKNFDGSRPEEPELNIHNVLYENDTSVWLSADQGLFKWNLRTHSWTSYSTGKTAPKQIAGLNPGQFIVSELRTGLFLFDKQQGAYSKLEANLIGNPRFNVQPFLKSPFFDQNGGLWVLNGETGLLFAHMGKAKMGSIPKPRDFRNADNYEFRTLIRDPQGKIWCSTFNNGIFVLSPEGQLLHHFHPDIPGNSRIADKQIYHMLLDRDQNIWIATSKGVFVYDQAANIFEPVLDETGNQVPNVSFLFQLNNDIILLSSLQDGLYRVTGTPARPGLQPVPFSQADQGLGFFVNLYEDRLGNIYVAKNYVEILVGRFRDGSMHFEHSLPVRGFIQGFYEDSDGRTLWISTSNGLVKTDKTNLENPPYVYEEKDGLNDKNLKSILADKNGDLWMGTAGGLVKFEKSEGRFVHFTLADGIRSTLFDGLAAVNLPGGALWFGGNNGITVVDPEKIRFLQQPPRIRITDIKVNDEPPEDLADQITGATNWSVIRNIKRKYRENTLSFQFVAIDYSDPLSTQLEYKMEGLDDNWVRLGKGEPGFVRYPKIPPGSYRFLVRAANSDGVWAKEPFQLAIRINPPFWQTTWFLLLFGAVSGVAAYAAVSWRIRQIREKDRLKTRVAENQLAALRAQMNPHFIFNSLNSINGYVLGRDPEQASHYLVKFASLMRLILDISHLPAIPLEKELEILDLYLQVEGMRLKIPLSYHFQVSETLDTYDTQIPTMILQPFVENAVWHGLASKEDGDGRILIEIAESGEYLKCTIQDNGVGREKATGIQAQKGRKHKSRAIDITRERLDIMNQKTKGHYSVNIEDLADDSGAPAGTRVTLLLPFP